MDDQDLPDSFQSHLLLHKGPYGNSAQYFVPVSSSSSFADDNTRTSKAPPSSILNSGRIPHDLGVTDEIGLDEVKAIN